MPAVNSDNAWEQIGRDDPYYGVITDPRYTRQQLTPDRLDEFLASGQRHVDLVLRTIRDHLDPAFAPDTAVDFGCGVGRLLIPLAGQCRSVVGVDVSEAMLREARQNCRIRSLDGVELVKGDDSLSGLTGKFDLILSHIVFQHIPSRRGEGLLDRLLAHLKTGGVAVVHLLYARDLPVTSRIAYRLRRSVPFAQGVLNVVTGRPWAEPLMQMNCYDLARVFRIIHDHQCNNVFALSTNHDGAQGLVLFCQKAGQPVA